MLPLGHSIPQFSCMLYHCYTDDTQMYISVKPSDLSNVTTLNQCLAEIRKWILKHFFQLHNGKTEVLFLFLFFCPRSGLYLHYFYSTSIQWLLIPYPRHHFWLSLTIDEQVKTVSQSCYFHLRYIARIHPILSSSSWKSTLSSLLPKRRCWYIVTVSPKLCSK